MTQNENLLKKAWTSVRYRSKEAYSPSAIQAETPLKSDNTSSSLWSLVAAEIHSWNKFFHHSFELKTFNRIFHGPLSILYM